MRRPGSVAAEALFALAITTMLFFAAFEFGRAVALRHSLDAGVALAARHLATRPDDYARAQELVASTLRGNLAATQAVVDQATASLAVCDEADPVCPPGLAAWDQRAFAAPFRVEAQVTWQPLAPIPFLTSVGARTIRVVHYHAVERYP